MKEEMMSTGKSLEARVRAMAHLLPPSDLGSTRAIQHITMFVAAEMLELARVCEGWEVNAAGQDYMTDGNQFWDADSIYGQARLDIAEFIRRELRRDKPRGLSASEGPTSPESPSCGDQND